MRKPNVIIELSDIIDMIASKPKFQEKIQTEWDNGEFIHPDGEEMFASFEEALHHQAGVRAEELIYRARLGNEYANNILDSLGKNND